MRQYLLTTKAQDDLIHIRHFSKKHWGNQQSIKYIQELKQTFEMLADMPLIGQKCLEDIYRFFHQHYAIYYTLANDSLIIIAILHHSMVPEAHLNNIL